METLWSNTLCSLTDEPQHNEHSVYLLYRIEQGDRLFNKPEQEARVIAHRLKKGGRVIAYRQTNLRLIITAELWGSRFS